VLLTSSYRSDGNTAGYKAIGVVEDPGSHTITRELAKGSLLFATS